MSIYELYTVWLGGRNRIFEEDMAALYKRKKATKKSITAMVAEAVSQYVREVEK